MTLYPALYTLRTLTIWIDHYQLVSILLPLVSLIRSLTGFRPSPFSSVDSWSPAGEHAWLRSGRAVRARKQCYGTRSFRPELVTHTSLWLECSHRIIPGSAADIVKYCWSDLTCHHGGRRWSPVRVLVHGLLAGVVARLRERARQWVRISGVFT